MHFNKGEVIVYEGTKAKWPVPILSGTVSWRKMSIMSCQWTEDRFMLYLNWYASEVGEDDVTIPFPRIEDFARYLGITHVSLSRAINDLVKRGEIAHPAKSRFVLLKKSIAIKPILHFVKPFTHGFSDF